MINLKIKDTYNFIVIIKLYYNNIITKLLDILSFQNKNFDVS